MTGLDVQPENRHRAAVLDYYRAVDADDVPGLLDLFADHAVYHRPGYGPMEGKRQLEDFYRERRIIQEGRHRVTTVLCQGDTVGVHGEFEGRLTDGSTTRLRFADFFVVDADGRFAERRTFFYAPMV